MENNKSECEEIIAELNEYKELLWQLSDEYKENVSAAEKKAAQEQEKRQQVEKELNAIRQKITTGNNQDTNNEHTDELNINLLGLPACVLDNKANILEYNNKFKFFIELLLLEIEDITDLEKFSEKINNKQLSENIQKYFQSNKNIFQNIFTAENSFQNQVKIILRIYRNELNNKHLALWIELQEDEAKNFNVLPNNTLKQDKIISKKTKQNNDNELITAIQSYAKRYEISSQLLSFINKKINKKAENITLIREIYNKIEKSFDLKKEAKELLKRIELKEKDFKKILKQKFPELTLNEQKHCLLIRQGLTYKEIAALMEITVNGVKIARNRLRKKLQLDGDTKTSEFIMKI